jgi:outer membrane protein OmpA-like peptidoglycan-associated protein
LEIYLIRDIYSKIEKMKNTLRLTESEFSELVKRLVNESKNEIDEISYDDYMSGETLQPLRNAFDKNQMVGVAYVLKNGSVRHMSAKRNIKSYVRSNAEKTEKQANVESNNDIKRVVDFSLYRKNLEANGGDKEMAAKSCWRTINLKDVLGFSVGGRFIDLRQENDILNRFGETINNSLTKSMQRAIEAELAADQEAEQNDEQMGIEGDVNEALGGGTTNARPDSVKTSLENKTIELGNNLFKLGSDKINTNSEEFKKAKDIITKSGAGKITLQGGASSAGSSNKYDNQGLADRRANNFKKALQDSGVMVSDISILPGVVTPNTDTPNSPEANKAQFVRFTMTKLQLNFNQELAIDNTALAKRVVPIEKVKVKTDIKTGGNYYMDVRITFPKDKSVKTILDLVNGALKGVATKVERIK